MDACLCRQHGCKVGMNTRFISDRGIVGRCGCRYVPVYFLPALLVHRQRLVLGPGAGAIWAKGAAAAARSSAFLALYCGLAWRGAPPHHAPTACCCVRHVTLQQHPSSGLGCILSGLC